MKWDWRAQDEPPPPQAAVGIGQATSRALLRAVERLDEGAREGLMLTANADVLVVTGAGERLPWCEGVAYAAPCEQAPGLWLLTIERPDLPLDLLQRAIARRHPQSPLLLLRAPPQLLPLHRALPARGELIAQIRAFWQD